MKDSIKERVKLQDVFDVLGVAVKGQTASCPLHSDRTPSLSFKDDLWYCFVCNVGGDVITLVEKTQNLTFKEALHWINETFSLGLTNEKPKRNYYLESLNENYNRLKTALNEEFLSVTAKYHALMESFETQFWEWTAKDYTFLETYHDRLDSVERQLEELENVRDKLRRASAQRVPKGRGF